MSVKKLCESCIFRDVYHKKDTGEELWICTVDQPEKELDGLLLMTCVNEYDSWKCWLFRRDYSK